MPVPEIPAGLEPPYIVIGTRHWLGEDWLHVDADASPLYCEEDGSQHPVDVVCDASWIRLSNQTTSFLYSNEALEHFSWRKTGDVVAEWARLVKPGGVLQIETPDFAAACQQLLSEESVDLHLRMQQIFFAEQLNPYDFHYAGITHLTLPHFMEQAGLVVEKVQRGWEVGWLRVIGRKL